MEPQALRAFLAVADTGSFTTAAKRVFRSQPAISMAVRSLEAELGRELFQRSPQGVRLTEAGTKLRELAGTLLREWDDVGARLQEALDDEPSGRLVVGAGEALLLHWLPPVVKRYRKLHSKVAVVLRHQPRAESLAQLRTGDVDLALRSTAGLRDGLELRPLLTSERCIIAPRGTGLPRRPTASSLARHPFVLPMEGAHSRTALQALFEREGLTLRVAVESGGWALLMANVAAGLGLAVVPDVAIAALDQRRLEVRRMGGLLGEDAFALILDPRRRPGRATEAFAEACLAQAR